MNTIIKNIRLTSHQLSEHKFDTPKELISWMGAIQAQDFTMAKWAIAIRLKSCTEQEVEDAFNRGDFLRTHIMRPTWHFVSSEDIRWLLKLTGDRIKLAWKYAKDLKIEEQDLIKCYRLLEKTLRDNNHQTKEEIAKLFEQGGLGATPRHIYHFMMWAEAEGIICSGSLKGEKQTYALLDERAPQSKDISKDEALAKLARRYLMSHSPATLQDFIWWSGLTIRDCRHAFGLIEDELIKDYFDSTELYIHNTYKDNIPLEDEILHFLPAYDEYLISYKNRTNVLDLKHYPKAFNNYGTFKPVILYNGHVMGNWKSKGTDLDVTFWHDKFKPNKKLLTQAEMKLKHYKKATDK
ncbi:winged helix DNA-binding domain-containing protein [Dysgonomonas sp. Marseille-P4361]|uniref:winged helix DNA-binding domain-containing protein n=1 Tax=Dysgonomonas sp. Marseille-P4361 TaxID=2161820 RepID=UPI001618A208|nr:winged helix DNA-binding domain-containing protein [Dysgonomonas sp. Marseille-P4361]